MRTAKSLTMRSLVLKGLGVAAVLVSIWATSTPAMGATFCFIGVSEVVVYYADASHTKEVGACRLTGSCGPAFCFGQKTNFITVDESECEVCT
jgi:hypothetical protein